MRDAACQAPEALHALRVAQPILRNLSPGDLGMQVGGVRFEPREGLQVLPLPPTVGEGDEGQQHAAHGAPDSDHCRPDERTVLLLQRRRGVDDAERQRVEPAPGDVLRLRVAEGIGGAPGGAARLCHQGRCLACRPAAARWACPAAHPRVAAPSRRLVPARSGAPGRRLSRVQAAKKASARSAATTTPSAGRPSPARPRATRKPTPCAARSCGAGLKVTVLLASRAMIGTAKPPGSPPGAGSGPPATATRPSGRIPARKAMAAGGAASIRRKSVWMVARRDWTCGQLRPAMASSARSSARIAPSRMRSVCSPAIRVAVVPSLRRAARRCSWSTCISPANSRPGRMMAAARIAPGATGRLTSRVVTGRLTKRPIPCVIRRPCGHPARGSPSGSAL
jgi:hypothetical protein